MRVAIYARVSTNWKNGNSDEQSRRRHRQDTDNQLFQLREWCAKTGHEIVEEYVEQISGGAGKEKRSEFARMFEDAHKRRFDIVLCWALDRFSREGMVPTIGYLQRLAAAGVGFHSYTAHSDDVGRAFRLMSATCSDRSRPAVPIDVGRGGGAPAGRV